MAMNWEKYTKPVERRKPIIFLINESVSFAGHSFGSAYGCCCERTVIAQSVYRLINHFRDNNIRADVAVVGFGSQVNLILPYTDISIIETDKLKTQIEKLPIPKAAVFGTGLLAVKDFLEDLEETPKDIYRPTVILITTNEPSCGWESCFEEFVSSGRSAKSQRLAICIPKEQKKSFFFEEGVENENGVGYEITNKAVKKFAEKGMILKCESSVFLYDEPSTMTEWLSFDLLEEKEDIIQEIDIPVLEDVVFDGDSIDEDSFI